jgi:hypothetical protein
MIVHVTGGEIPQDEIEQYKARAEKMHPGTETLNISVDGDHVDLEYVVAPTPYERIRRITGYLVGTVERWNDAKREELGDRVKHAAI